MKYLFLCLAFTINLSSQNLKVDADNFYANGNYTRAIKIYKSLKNLDEVYDKIAKANIAIGNFGEGLVNYKMAIDANPEDALLKYEYAKLLSRTKNYKDASTLFKNLIISDSLNPNYYYELGIILEKQNDTTAIWKFAKTYKLDGTHQKAIFKIAKQHIIKRKFQLAHQILDKGLESYEENVELISLKAQAYYFQDYHSHAVVWFKKLIDLGEKSEFIHEKLSLCYAQNFDYTDAIYHRKEALKYSPNDVNAMHVIGSYYKSISNFEKAEEYISKALKLQDRSLTDEYQNLGVVLNRQKKYKEAIKAFKTSLKEDASNIMSEFFLLRTKDEFYQDLDTKIKMYETYIQNTKKSPFLKYAEGRLKVLKDEKFLEEN